MLHQALSSPATCLPPNRVYSSATACLPPPPDPFEPGYLSHTQPCQSEHNCLSPASTRPFRAWLLVSHPTMSIQAQPLISRLHQVPPSLIARLLPPPDPFKPGYLSPTQPCQSERNCLCPTPHQVPSSLIARPQPNCVHLSATARVPPGPCVFWSATTRRSSLGSWRVVAPYVIYALSCNL